MTHSQETKDFLLQHLPSIPDTVVVLGSRVVFEERFETQLTLPFASIPHAHTTAIEGHQGQLVYG